MEVRAQNGPIGYRGQLTAGASAANGLYDFRFKLFNVPDGNGVQLGRTEEKLAVNVTNGVFSVLLDFDATLFDGARRFLEISVKPAGDTGLFRALAPRQQVTPVPYAIHSLNAEQLSGVPSTKFVRLNDSGNLALGTASPFADFKLDIAGSTLFETGGSGGGYISFHTPNAETGMTINGDGNKRADIRFDGSTLKLLATGVAGPPPSGNGIAISTSGNVGIGTASPVYKLDVASQGGAIRAEGTGPAATGVTGVGGALGVEGVGVGSSGIGVRGVGTTFGVSGIAQSARAVGVYAEGPGAAIYAAGNAAQRAGDSGFVKAMVYVNPFLPADQYVVRCYNSQTSVSDATKAPCGITVTRIHVGEYVVNFGFNVEDRFFSLTTMGPSGGGLGSTFGTVVQVNGNTVRLRTQFSQNNDGSDDAAFYLLVY